MLTSLAPYVRLDRVTPNISSGFVFPVRLRSVAKNVRITAYSGVATEAGADFATGTGTGAEAGAGAGADFATGAGEVEAHPLRIATTTPITKICFVFMISPLARNLVIRTPNVAVWGAPPALRWRTH